MKMLTRTLCLLLIAVLGLLSSARSQSILDPTDPVITYNSASPPASPAWNTIGKWVRTVRLSWNTTNFKCYVYNGIPFRLRFPLSYNPTANDGKKYPIMIFWHGSGEGGHDERRAALQSRDGRDPRRRLDRLRRRDESARQRTIEALGFRTSLTKSALAPVRQSFKLVNSDLTSATKPY